MPNEIASPIGLIGGEEFRKPAEAFDRLLLSLAPRTPASVAIVPTAAALDENPYFAAANGVKHFERLGAEPYPVNIHDATGANDDGLVEELRRADIVYFSGGNPSHLLDSLNESAAWRCLVDLAQQGVILAGSSAGAMVLGERMLYRGQDLDGLALLARIVVLPHFERSMPERVQKMRSGLPPDFTLLGIDGATGCVLHAGKWLVAGPGQVSVITASNTEVYSTGERFSLPGVTASSTL